MKIIYPLVLLALITSCARGPLKHAKDSMREASSNPVLVDDMSKESFLTALRKHIDVMKTSRLVMDPMTFGEKKIEKAKYIAALEEIFLHEDDWMSWIEKNFIFHEVYGKEEWGEVMVTGYYEPRVFGAHERSEKFSQALYGMPNDLVTVDLKKFALKFPHGIEGVRGGQLQGRVENQTLIPYYDRKAIDGDQKLVGQKIELAWVDPIDAFFIQIQGSGTVEFEDGEVMRVGYAAQNGHTYLAIGKFLTEHIPMEEMSMQKIRLHLQTLSKKEQQKILNKNPSYIFFKKLDGGALTYAGMEVSEGRTIATDLHLFPKGAMAFLETETPEFGEASSHEPVTWKKLSRLVFDQDTGGAIRGPGRVDLYFGQGESASSMAGVMRQKGRLYYLLPKFD